MAEKKKKRAPRRPPVPPEITARRERTAWQLRAVHGLTLSEITRKLNEMFPDYPLKSDREGVRKMLERQEREYIEAHKTEVERIKAEAGASLDYVRYEAADAWEKSQDLLRVIKKREDQTVEQILKAQTGDAAYLKVIKDAAIEKAKLFGAVAPTKHEVDLEFDIEAWKAERKKRLDAVRKLKD